MSTDIRETTSHTLSAEGIQPTTKGYETSSAGLLKDITTTSSIFTIKQEVKTTISDIALTFVQTAADSTTHGDLTTFTELSMRTDILPSSSHKMSLPTEGHVSTGRGPAQHATTENIKSSSVETKVFRDSTHQDITTESLSSTLQYLTGVESIQDLMTRIQELRTGTVTGNTATSDYNMYKSSAPSRDREETRTMTYVTTSFAHTDSRTAQKVTQGLISDVFKFSTSSNEPSTGQESSISTEDHLSTGNMMTTVNTQTNPKSSILTLEDHRVHGSSTASEVLTSRIATTSERLEKSQTMQSSFQSDIFRDTSTEGGMITSEDSLVKDTTIFVSSRDRSKQTKQIHNSTTVVPATTKQSTVDPSTGKDTTIFVSSRDRSKQTKQLQDSTTVVPATTKQSTVDPSTGKGYISTTMPVAHQVEPSSPSPNLLHETSTTGLPVFASALIDSGIYGMLISK